MKQFDIVVFGATGFTGKLVAEYLLETYGVNQNFNWAIAGRDKSRLMQVVQALGAEDLPCLEADVNDLESLHALASLTRVLCTTVGPYSVYGSKVVEACVKNNTHYCDLAGEVPWIRSMIDQYHQPAMQRKVKIVHCCGFDSVPSDMGAFFLQKEAMKKWGNYCSMIKNGLRAMKGSMSGGTYASMSIIQEQAQKDPSLYKVLFNPYSLNPLDHMEGADTRDPMSARFDTDFNRWTSPFIMATINTRVVRRSHALMDFPYGKEFVFEEFLLHSKGWKGRMSATMNVLPLAILGSAKPGTWKKKILDAYFPKPGEGPSKSDRNDGFFNFHMLGIAGENKIKARISGNLDPGYGFTSRMLGEAAVSLAGDSLPETYGVLTPSIAMGDGYLNRLIQQAEMKFEII